MTYFMAIGLGLVSGAALGFAWGLLAAELYVRSFGAGDGGSAMGGFFTMAPIGFIAGFLLGSAFFLSNEAPGLSRGLSWGGGITVALGAVIFMMPWAMRQQEQGRFAALNLEMEFEVQAEVPTESCLWGYQGHTEEAKANYPLIKERVEDGKKVFSASMNMSDYPDRRLALFSIGGTLQSFEVPVRGQVTSATDWSAWEQGKDLRFRWRMH